MYSTIQVFCPITYGCVRGTATPEFTLDKPPMSAEHIGSSSLVSSAFPAPPPFVKYFTPENLSALKQQQKLGVALDELPPELQYLVPPPPPEKSYRCFGDVWQVCNSSPQAKTCIIYNIFNQIPDVLPTLPQMGITQLYNDPITNEASSSSSASILTSATTTTTTLPPPSNTRALSLLRLSKSLLLSYLELLSALAINPALSASKLADLRTIMINMHHLINEYRPHQARETLIMMMEEQVDKCRRERDENLKAKELVNGVLESLERLFEAGMGVRAWGDTSERSEKLPLGDPQEVDHIARERDLEIWRALESLDGSQAP